MSENYSFQANRTMFMSLIRPIRDADFDQGRDFLKRYLSRMECNADQTRARIISLAQTDNFSTLQDALVQYLKAEVGFTSELDELTRQLSTETLKKLCSGAVALWKRRGTPVSMVNMIRLLTGRSVTYRDWFYYRTLLDGADPNSMAFGEDQLGYDVNINGNDVSVNDEFFSQLRMMDPGIQLDQPPGTPTNAQLLIDIVSLCRPLSERVEIALLDFWDTFEDGSTSRWDASGGITITSGIANLPSNTFASPHLRVITADGGLFNDYTEYVVGMKININIAGNVSFSFLSDNNGEIGCTLAATADGRGGAFTITDVTDWNNGEDAGSFGSFPTIVKTNVWYTLRVWVRGGNGSGGFRVRCTLDGQQLCDVAGNVNDVIPDFSDAPRHGAWAMRNNTTGAVQITDVETWRTPRMRFATVGPGAPVLSPTFLSGA